MCRLPHLLLCVAACLITTAPANADENGSTPSSQNSVAALTFSQWVQPNEAGLLKGRVVTHASDGTSLAVVKANVTISDKAGQVLRGESLTNEKGEFVIKDVKPGVYALSARSGNYRAVCAMHILADGQYSEGQFAREVEISAAAIDYETLRSAIVRYFPVRTKPSDSLIDGSQLSELAQKVASPGSFRVTQVGGGMLGQIFAAGVEGTSLPNAKTSNVFILKDGSEVARAVTDENGEFQIMKLGLGTYSLIAVGPDGLGLVGFELVKGLTGRNALTTTDGKTFVQEVLDNGFSMQVAPAQQLEQIEQEYGEQPIPDDGFVDGGMVDGGFIDGEIIDGGIIDGGFVDGMPVDGFGSSLAGGGGYAPGGGGGGFSGGGGGGGGLLGGGGLGGIAALAGIGGLAAVAISDDDDDVIQPAPIASPAFPN